MGEHSRNFSQTETYILHTGVKWIEEAPEAFATKLYHRLWRNHPEFQGFLHAIGSESFSRNFIRFLAMVKDELLRQQTIQASPKEFLARQALTIEDVHHSHQFPKMARTFLNVFSELAEDAWSPALESAWNKAIDEVNLVLVNPQPDDSPLTTMASPVSIIRRRRFLLSRTLILLLGTLLMVTGGMISKTLWNRCRLTDAKRLQPPVWKKAWSG